MCDIQSRQLGANKTQGEEAEGSDLLWCFFVLAELRRARKKYLGCQVK